MINFGFNNPANIIFGKDAENRVGELTSSYGGKVLLHYGGGSIRSNGLYDRVINSLKQHNIEFYELGGVKPNPRLSTVYDGIKICKENGIDFILAVGGGSVIDSAKAIAAGVYSDKDIWHYYMHGDCDELKAALPLGVVLTIPAAGSETSDSSVITNEDGGYKRSIGTPILIPKFAIMNPEITFSMPKAQIANGSSDILAHLLERYFTMVPNVDLTDRLLEATMKTVIFNAPIAMKNSDDYNVRAEIMLAGALAHNDLFGSGRIGDWSSHLIEHELSAFYDIAHGAGLSIIFPAWMKYVYKQNIDKFVQLAVRVFGVDMDYCDKEAIVLEMIERLELWYKRLGLPTRMSDIGIGADKIEKMAERVLLNRGDGVGNFMLLAYKDVCNIYRTAL